jgi:hypothetical protein
MSLVLTTDFYAFSYTAFNTNVSYLEAYTLIGPKCSVLVLVHWVKGQGVLFIYTYKSLFES